MAWGQVLGDCVALKRVDVGCLYIHIFLLALPIGLSSSSRTMHTSSMSLICSSSYPSRSLSCRVAACVVRARFICGKRRNMLSALIDWVSVAVVVALILAIVIRSKCNAADQRKKTWKLTYAGTRVVWTPRLIPKPISGITPLGCRASRRKWWARNASPTANLVPPHPSVAAKNIHSFHLRSSDNTTHNNVFALRISNTSGQCRTRPTKRCE